MMKKYLFLFFLLVTGSGHTSQDVTFQKGTGGGSVTFQSGTSGGSVLFFKSPPAPTIDVLTGLVAYYDLKEPGDTDSAIDSTGITGSLSANGSLPSTSGPGAHLARSSDGSSYFNSITAQPFTGGPFSFNFWINQDAEGGQYILDARGDTGNGIAIFYAKDGGFIDMGIYSGGGGYNGSNGVTGPFDTLGNWGMITLCQSETEYSMYYNGVLFANDALTLTDYTDSNTQFAIDPSVLPIVGKSDMYGLWNVYLNSTQVDYLYNGGSGRIYSEL